MTAPVAVSLIVGIGGQDGRYLTQLLQARGSRVVGLDRAAVDVRDRSGVARLLAELEPAEVYYLAGVFGSSEAPAGDAYADFRRCSEVHVDGWLNFLDAAHAGNRGIRLFYASSSRVFGSPAASPQDELTPHAPRCMYGITKSAGMQLGKWYRSRGVHCSSGILYNHESPLRPPSFVSRKIVAAAVDIKLGTKQTLTVGNLSAAVDWGSAQDCVDAMARILALEQADDFVIATGELHTVQQLAEAAFAAVGLPWQPHVVEDRSLLNTAPAGPPLVGDSTRLRDATGWQPRISFHDMIREMVKAELRSRHSQPA